MVKQCLPYIQSVYDRSSRLQMFFKLGVLKNFAIFTGIQLCWILFLKKLQACNFNKKRLQHKCLPANIANFLRAAFFIEHLRWLLFFCDNMLQEKLYFC